MYYCKCQTNKNSDVLMISSLVKIGTHVSRGMRGKVDMQLRGFCILVHRAPVQVGFFF
jgi:hypothetical protein